MKSKIKKNDRVKVLSGKDRGKTGKVLSIFPTSRKLVIERVNLMKKHRKPKRQGEKGEILEIELPISFSKVALICPQCKKAARIGFQRESNETIRICKKCKKKI